MTPFKSGVSAEKVLAFPLVPECTLRFNLKLPYFYMILFHILRYFSPFVFLNYRLRIPFLFPKGTSCLLRGGYAIRQAEWCSYVLDIYISE